MNKISYFLKSSKLLYNIYFYVMSFLLKLLGLFVGHDDYLILFNSYGGKKYDDSPKVIYEELLQDSRFDKYRLVWALQNPEKTVVPGRATLVKTDSFKYFVTALRAKVWVTNSSMERGLDFKKRRTLCLNTWHGTPIKVMGVDIKGENQSFRSKINVRADIMLAQSQYDIDIFSHAFRLPIDIFRMTGLPRNDILANYTQDDVNRIREKIGIEKDKIVLLYAPTCREYSKGAMNEVILNVPINLQHWQDVLGDKYLILFRAHYEVAKHMKVDGYPMFMDMSAYPDLNELMIVSDALISDYSSIYFDFSIMHKPMYCFAYDYNEYVANRGMYLNLENELPCDIHRNEDSLLVAIKGNTNNSVTIDKVINFQKKYVPVYGQAATKSCDLIYKEIVRGK